MGYRFSGRFIRKWEKRLTIALLAGFLGPLVLIGAVLVIGSAVAPDLGDDDPAAGVLLGIVYALVGVSALTVVAAVYIGAILGGLALHRHGWLVGTLFATWFFAGIWVWYLLADTALGVVVYFGGHAVIVVAFRYLGRKAKAVA